MVVVLAEGEWTSGLGELLVCPLARALVQGVIALTLGVTWVLTDVM